MATGRPVTIVVGLPPPQPWSFPANPVPDFRMALDVDGCAMYKIVGSSRTALTAPQIAQICSDTDPSGGDYQLHGASSTAALYIQFPEPRTVLGYFYNIGSANNATHCLMETSTDSTDGINGTWTTATYPVIGDSQYFYGPLTSGRWDFLDAVDGVGAPPTTPPPLGVWGYAGHALVTGVRFTTTTSSAGGVSPHVALYGPFAANSTRLEFRMASADQRPGFVYNNWGKVPQGSSGDKFYVLKNLATALIAGGITVFFDTLSDTTPSVPGQYLVSVDGGVTFAATGTITTLPPGASSPLIIVRRNTPTDAVAGTWAVRLRATATTWT